MSSQACIATLAIFPDSQAITLKIASELPDVGLYTTHQERLSEAFAPLPGLVKGTKTLFDGSDVLLFISTMGICVCTITPLLRDKHNDPVVLCVDTTGRYIISVASGHIGGADEWTDRITHILGAEPVIATRGDRRGLWALDTSGAGNG